MPAVRHSHHPHYVAPRLTTTRPLAKTHPLGFPLQPLSNFNTPIPINNLSGLFNTLPYSTPVDSTPVVSTAVVGISTDLFGLFTGIIPNAHAPTHVHARLSLTSSNHNNPFRCPVKNHPTANRSRVFQHIIRPLTAVHSFNHHTIFATSCANYLHYLYLPLSAYAHKNPSKPPFSPSSAPRSHQITHFTPVLAIPGKLNHTFLIDGFVLFQQQFGSKSAFKLSKGLAQGRAPVREMLTRSEQDMNKLSTGGGAV